MTKSNILLFSMMLLLGCKEKTTNDTTVISKVEFNQVLADELDRMAKVDQIAAYVQQGKQKELSDAQWKAFKDSVYKTHGKRLQEVFTTNGYTGYDLVGKKGSSNFWVMVQHADHNPQFQLAVLEKMKIEVEKENADPRDYGLLVDRVKLNTDQAQVYGTQVTYNMHTGQAYPKKLGDSVGVNERRKSLGFESLEAYLNDMSTMHFEMNKEYYAEKGVTEPTLYLMNK